MKRIHKIAIGFALLGFLSLFTMVFGAVIEVLFDQKFGVGDEIAMIWVWGFIILPIFIAMALFQPRVISFAIAILAPLALAFYGAVNQIAIHTRWHFWIITSVSIVYIALFPFDACEMIGRPTRRGRQRGPSRRGLTFLKILRVSPYVTLTVGPRAYAPRWCAKRSWALLVRCPILR